MQTAESEDALLVKAKAEEKAYNWVEAAKLYEQVAESFLGKNSTDKAAETYRMLGYAYSRAARTVYPRTARTRRDNTHRLWKKESKQFRERHEHAIIAYRKAMDLFKRVKNKPEELECEGLVFYVTSISLTSLTEAKDAISKSLELFIQSSKFYTENNDEECIARTLSQAAITSFVLLNLCSEQEELLEVSQKGIEDLEEK